MLFKKFNNSKIALHYFFLTILSLNYLIPFLIFGSITLFYLDTLDSEIIYNRILSKIINNEFEDPINIFLGGSITKEYFRRLFQPYVYIYTFFNTELAYWIVDILVKLTSYISFFLLAKKINKNLHISCLVACLYASLNLPTHEGFGLSILPYIIYLSIYKKNLRIKHFIIIILFGLNSDLLFAGFALPAIFLMILFYKKKSNINFFYLIAVFSLSITLSNLNLILLYLSNVEFHRNEFLRESLTFIETIKHFLYNLFNIPNAKLDWVFLKTIPYTIIYILTFFFSVFLKKREAKIIIFIILATAFFLAIIKFQPLAKLINQNNNFIKTISWIYISQSFLILYPILILIISKYNKKFIKILTFFIYPCIFFFQINSSIVPFYKEKIIKIENYQNIYTFDGYYKYYNYKKIKETTKNERVMSVGLDPMVAVYHDIKVIDGYHNLYPLNYKKKFRKIIEPELEKNTKFKNYFDNYGSRVYATLYEPKNKENIHFNYKEAKKLKVKFIISKYFLISDDIKLIYDECFSNNKLCLYEIK